MELTEIQSQLEQVRAAMASENQRGAMAEQEKILNLQQQEQDLVRQLIEVQDQAQQQEKETRDQSKQEVIEQTVDVLPAIFDALLPSEVYEELLGLTKYGELRQQFYQIIRAHTADQIETVHQQRELEIANKDEKIRLLNKQAMEVQQKLDSLNPLMATYEEQIQREKDDHDKTQAELATLRSQYTSLQAVCAGMDETISDLHTQLQTAKQTKAEPSANVKDLITQIKSKNTQSVDDLIAKFNDRQKSEDVKLPLPEVPTAPATFLATQSEDDTVHNTPTETYYTGAQPPVIEVPTFQIPNSDTTDGLAHEESGVQQEGATLEERVAALEVAVFGVRKAS